MILSNKQITKALIRLPGCAGWSAHVLFANHRRQVFSRRGPYYLLLEYKKVDWLETSSLHAGYFSCFCCRLLPFFKINFFKKLFQKHFQSVKQFRSRSGPTQCRSWSRVQTVCKGYQQTTKVTATGATCSNERVITLCRLMEFSVKFDRLKSGWSFV